MSLDSVLGENIQMSSDPSDHAYGVHTCSSNLTLLPSYPSVSQLLLRISQNELFDLIATFMKSCTRNQSSVVSLNNCRNEHIMFSLIRLFSYLLINVQNIKLMNAWGRR